jgi:polyphosphate glucokinase
MKTLVIDVGGTNIKMLATGHDTPRKFPSGPRLTALQMVENVQRATADWQFDRISIGYPGPVIHDKLALEPRAGLGGFRLRGRLRQTGQADQRRRDAGAGQLRGGPHAFSGIGRTRQISRVLKSVSISTDK